METMLENARMGTPTRFFSKEMNDKHKIILDFIKRHTLGVIATSNEDRPESAVIEYGETDSLELIFDTYSTSRKYKNLLYNSMIAIVIGWDENITVQYEGKAYELDGKELEKYKEIYFQKNPRAKKWESKPGITYFKITPHWIRYSDLNKSPWKIFEITL